MTKTRRNLQAKGINTDKPLNFSFDGQSYTGYEGDTLASALLANGVRLIGRGFKYHRPRGVISAGSEEPNAIVELGAGAELEPNTRATMINLFEGLEAKSQNRWPSLKFDISSINNSFSRFLVAGFYYKTFMWPAKGWMFYEAIIRRAAGLGKATKEFDPKRYDRVNTFCDVLVVGAGVSGISAALALAEQGKKVIIADEHSRLGGVARYQADDQIDQWLADQLAKLRLMDNVTMMPSTTIFGAYDSGDFGAVEQAQSVNDYSPRLRYWRINAGQAIYATGALERPLVFGNNDLPGVMVAHALKAYANYYGAIAGNEVVLFTNNDSIYELAQDLDALQCNVTVVDSRADHELANNLRNAGIQVYSNAVVTDAKGWQQVERVNIQQQGLNFGQACDFLGMSGGWTPTLHLQSHRGSKPIFDDELVTLTLAQLNTQDSFTVGSAAGVWDHSNCIRSGEMAANGETSESLQSNSNRTQALWYVPQSKYKQLVDYQNDVALPDIQLAAREGFKSVEHAKRYTTLGMATDQGKTANVNALAILAEARGCSMQEVGTTTFRPPYTPVAMGAFSGRSVGHHFAPVRRTGIHHWHEQNGAIMLNVGQWQRAHYYPVDSAETLGQAYVREMNHVRSKVGIVDVSTLGKICVQGPDAGELINRVYLNRFDTLKVGKVRYGVMLREDGHVYDDGTTTRVSENEYLMTTTTVNAASVMLFLEYLTQIVWPELKVQVFSVTDQWAGIALAGPESRSVLERVVDDADVSNEALPFMGYLEATIGGVEARIYRISFSGELAYEINVPADYGESVWQYFLDKGKDFDLKPYGTESMGALRIEKGHVVSAELDGRTTVGDIGFAKMLENCKKPLFIGQHYARREAFNDSDRLQLVGLVSTDKTKAFKNGSQLLAQAEIEQTPMNSLGHITSMTYSPELDENIALAFIKGGLERWQDKIVYAHFPVRDMIVEAKVVSPHFLDPKGERLHG